MLVSEDDVVETSAAHLSERFTTAHSSPFSSGKLLEDVGYAGDGRAVSEILNGSYAFPEGCSAATIQLCTEAAKLYKKTSGALMKTTVTMLDFQNW